MGFEESKISLLSISPEPKMSSLKAETFSPETTLRVSKEVRRVIERVYWARLRPTEARFDSEEFFIFNRFLASLKIPSRDKYGRGNFETWLAGRTLSLKHLAVTSAGRVSFAAASGSREPP